VEAEGLFAAIAQGKFADIKRPAEGGKGREGVAEKNADYWNPVADFLKKRLGIGG